MDKPNEVKTNERVEGRGLVAGMSSMPGWRLDQEVRGGGGGGGAPQGGGRAACPGAPHPPPTPPLPQDAHQMVVGVEGHPDYSWFAVFDGHGGALTSKIASERLLTEILATPEWHADSTTPAGISAAIVKGFLNFDAYLRKVRPPGGGGGCCMWPRHCPAEMSDNLFKYVYI